MCHCIFVVYFVLKAKWGEYLFCLYSVMKMYHNKLGSSGGVNCCTIMCALAHCVLQMAMLSAVRPGRDVTD